MWTELARKILVYASVPVVVTSSYAIYTFKKQSITIKKLSYFLIVSLVIEVVSKTLWFLKVNNFPILHIYTLAGFLTLILFYKAVLDKFIPGKVFIVITSLFISFTIINSIFIQSIFESNSYALTLESVLILILSLISFYYLLKVQPEVTPDVVSILSANTGIFIYFTCNVILFTLSSKFSGYSPDFRKYVWAVHALVALLMYSCFFIALWKNTRS